MAPPGRGRSSCSTVSGSASASIIVPDRSRAASSSGGRVRRSPSVIVATLTAFALIVGDAGPLGAQGEPSIARVGIQGNLRVEEDAIRVHLRSQVGQPFDQDAIDRDIRAVYAMGFFDQVDADVRPAGPHRVGGVFRAKARPLLRHVKIEGNKKVKREELEGALK